MFIVPPFSRQIRMFDVLSRAQSKYQKISTQNFTQILPFLTVFIQVLSKRNLINPHPLILIGDYFFSRFSEEDEGAECRNHRLCFRQYSGKRHFILLTDVPPDAWT